MDFETIKNNAQTAWIDLINNNKPVLYFGAASCGMAAGIMDVKKAASEALAKMDIEAELVDVGCFGPCYLEPLVYIQNLGLNPYVIPI